MEDITNMYPTAVLQGVPDHSDVLILNIQYIRQRKLSDGKYSPDYLYIVYRDNTTMKKKLQIITNPSVDIYTTKPEYMNNFKTQREAIPFNMVDKHHVSYREKERFLYKMLSNNLLSAEDKMIKLTIDRGTELGNYSIKKEIHKWRHAYYSDFSIEEYVQTSAYMRYKATNFKITKSFLDIETDFEGASKADIEIGARPINAVTVTYDYDPLDIMNKHHKPKVFVYLLRNHKRYKEQAHMEKHMGEFMMRVRSNFDEKYGEADYKISFYDDEAQMLYDIFKIQHMLKPDFCGIWNMSFDILYFQKRMIYLGLPQEVFFCHPDFKNTQTVFHIDKRYENDFKNRGDSFNCLSYTKYYDQMLLYPARRKGEQDYGSSSLDNIAKIEVKARKRKFKFRTTNVINAAIEEYMNFVLYNINDVWLQVAIERKVEDLDDVFMRSYECGVRYDKTNRMTASLKTLWDISHFEQGYVMGNNININNTDKFGSEDIADDDQSVELQFKNRYEARLKGAIVGNPTNLNHTGADIYKNGKRSNRLFLDLVDLDFAGLYPNIKMVNNISKSSQYGRLIIPEPVSLLEYGLTPQLRGGEFIDDFETHDWLKVGLKWFGLKRTEAYISEFKEYIDKGKNNKIIPICDKNGEFFKLWSKKMSHVLTLLYPNANNKHFLYKIYRRDVQDIDCFVYNNYENIEYPTTLLSIVDWIINEKPILTESGTFFKRPSSMDDISPGLKTLSKLGIKRSTIKNKELEYEQAGDKDNAKLCNLGQNRIKRFMNSDYGIGGSPISFSYNYHVAQSVTSKGQTLISTAYTIFDNFLTDSIQFYDMDELLHYISNIVNEKPSYDDAEYIDSDKSVDDVASRLLQKCTKIKINRDILYGLLNNLPQQMLNRLYYKSNLHQFIKDNSKIQKMMHSFGVNTTTFLDPNKPPKTTIKALKKISDVIIDYCFYNHTWYGRVDRLIHNKRNNVITLDTDSNIITIHDLLNLSKKFMSRYGNASNKLSAIITENNIDDLLCAKIDHEHFKGVNTCAFLLTDVINRALSVFEKSSNVEDHLLGVYKMKNEFYYSAMLINTGKKRYLGKILLREGKFLPKGKRDVKGFDFIKISAASEEISTEIQDILFDHIVTSDVDIASALKKFVKLEKKLRNSLESGESTYLTPVKVKTIDSYESPMTNGTFKATYLWNKLYPENEITLPNVVNLIKLNINSIKDIAGLAVDNKDIFDKLCKLMKNPKTNTNWLNETNIGSGPLLSNITQIAVPLGIDEIPPWILQYANFDTMVDNTMNLVIPLLEEIGVIPIFKRESNKHLSNLIDVG